MVGPRIFHVHQTCSYPGFIEPDKALEAMNRWLASSDFKVRRKSSTFSKGSKHGIHVNFVPKFRLFVERLANGSSYVKFDYYAKMKIGTLVVVGVLTSGISTAVGVGTYAIRLIEADDFVAGFWAFVDSLAKGSSSIVKYERWVRDTHGNYALQPANQQGAIVSQTTTTTVNRAAPVSSVQPVAPIPQPIYTRKESPVMPPPYTPYSQTTPQYPPQGPPSAVYGHQAPYYPQAQVPQHPNGPQYTQPQQYPQSSQQHPAQYQPQQYQPQQYQPQQYQPQQYPSQQYQPQQQQQQQQHQPQNYLPPQPYSQSRASQNSYSQPAQPNSQYPPQYYSQQPSNAPSAPAGGFIQAGAQPQQGTGLYPRVL